MTKDASVLLSEARDLLRSPAGLAALFCELNCDEQAAFFACVARESARWTNPAHPHWMGVGEAIGRIVEQEDLEAEVGQGPEVTTRALVCALVTATAFGIVTRKAKGDPLRVECCRCGREALVRVESSHDYDCTFCGHLQTVDLVALKAEDGRPF